MLKKISDKNVFYISLVVVIYFIFLYVNSYIVKAEYVLIGVLQESLTIPMLIIQFILLIIVINRCISNKFDVKTYTFFAFIMLIVNSLFVLFSFIR